MEVSKLSWEDIEETIGTLASQIRDEGFAPDYLIGITKGGLIPLYFLSKEFDASGILTVSARSYKKDARGELTVTYLPDIDLNGKNVLLVDEISDTGNTMQVLAGMIREKYAVAQLKTLALVVNKVRCQFWPDYHGIEDDRWIVFPWEKKEFPEYFQD